MVAATVSKSTYGQVQKSKVSFHPFELSCDFIDSHINVSTKIEIKNQTSIKYYLNNTIFLNLPYVCLLEFLYKIKINYYG